MMKRLHQNPSESSKPIEKPKHYACAEGKVFIEMQGQKHTITLLQDSGSNIFS